MSDVTAHVPQEELGIQVGLAELTNPSDAPRAECVDDRS
jgi:hypothetical protein